MYLALKNWERDATQMGAVILENRQRVVATVRGVVVGRWDKGTREGVLKRAPASGKHARRAGT